MRFARPILGVLTPLMLFACATPTETAAPPATALNELTADFHQGNDGPKLLAVGNGVIDLSAVVGAEDATFFFHATVKHGQTHGSFRQRRIRNGLIIDFSGTITCMTVDAELGRARFGGVITENNSTDPAFMTANHEVGDDVWFRVQEGDRETGVVDASTTLGFKPTLVNTSAEYCALPFTGLPQWNPASTFPLTRGNIHVRP